MEVVNSKGLVVDFAIRWGDFSFSQPPDYWGVPFQCACCRKLGHKMCVCPLEVIYGVRGVNFDSPKI